MDDIICNLARRFGKLGHKNSPYRFKNRLNGTHMQLCLENDVSNIIVQYLEVVHALYLCTKLYTDLKVKRLFISLYHIIDFCLDTCLEYG